MYCQKCGQEITDEVRFCSQCDGQQNVVGDFSPMTLSSTEDKNPLAVWGFVCAIVGLGLPISGIDIILSAAGAMMSIMGVKKVKMRGLAVAGIVIGVIGVVGALVITFIEQPDVPETALLSQQSLVHDWERSK